MTYVQSSPVHVFNMLSCPHEISQCECRGCVATPTDAQGRRLVAVTGQEARAISIYIVSSGLRIAVKMRF
jgi:hypothetical protein